MIFLRNRVDFTFKTKSKHVMECGLGDSFYLLMYGDHTVMINNKSEKICFPIPVDYPSFVLSLGKSDFNDCFEFKNFEDKKKFEKWAKDVNMGNGKIIKEFKFMK